MWLEDFHIGDHLRSPEVLVTADQIVAFAEAFDPQPGHLSQESALATPFKGLAASGWHTAAISMRLFVDMGFTEMVGAGVTLDWPTPTRPGDRLHLEIRVTEVRESRTKPDRGIVVVEYDTVNQDGEPRQRASTRIMVWRKPSSGSGLIP